MRYREFIVEEEIPDVIQRDCQPWLQQAGIYAKSVWRGQDNLDYSINKVKARLKDRRPSNTPKDIHDMVNGEFTKMFGIPYRNAVFASMNKMAARNYGQPFVFMPIGNFRFCWSPTVDDMWYEYTEENLNILNVLSFIRHGDYTEKDLLGAIKSQHEIMFWCEEFYMINPGIL